MVRGAWRVPLYCTTHGIMPSVELVSRATPYQVGEWLLCNSIHGHGGIFMSSGDIAIDIIWLLCNATGTAEPNLKAIQED